MINSVNYAIKFKTINKPLIIASDNDFLKLDACNMITNHWQKQGFKLHKVYIDKNNDWLELLQLVSHNSLFSERKIIIVELNQKCLTKNYDQKISQLFSSGLKDFKLVFLTKKLTANTKKTSFYKGAVDLTIWPLKPNEIMAWSKNQATALSINASTSLLQELLVKSDYAPQVIKNNLNIVALMPNKQLNLELIAGSETSKDAWQIIDLALAGEVKDLIAIAKNLNNNEITSLHNACVYTLKNCVKIEELIASGNTATNAVNAVLSWPKQRQAYQNAITRNNNFNWRQLLKKAIELDLQIKGKTMTEPLHLQLTKILLAIAAPTFEKYIL